MDNSERPASSSGDGNAGGTLQITMDPPPASPSTQPDHELSPATQTQSQQGSLLNPVTSRSSPLRHRSSTIRLRRLPSSSQINSQSLNAEAPTGRRRSTSAPQRPQWHTPPRNELARLTTAEAAMPTV